jgi:hypothetical protein
MKAVWYNKAHDFEIKDVPIPEISDEEILLKVRIGGLCGTDVSPPCKFLGTVQRIWQIPSTCHRMAREPGATL